MQKENNYIHPVTSHNQRVSVCEIIGTATRGGMENHISGFLRNLPKDQFKVTCICPCESLFTKTLRNLGVEKVYVTPLADNPEWRSVQMAIEVAHLHNVDVFHAHMPKSHVLATVAGALVHKPVVATVHGMHVTAHELGVALAGKSHLITNCQETYIQALALGVPSERVNLFHNGVDVQDFSPAKKNQTFLRDQINVPANATLIGFVGRLEYDKGPDLFLRAAGHIHELLPDAHFAVVGDGSMLDRLHKLRKQMQLESSLHFIEWSDDPSAIYPSFDIMAHTSRNDGTSLVLLEAMASGLPVVAMSVGGVREMISNEHTGMLVDPNDYEGVANQVVSLLQQPGIVQRMGAAARKRVEEDFNISTNSAKTAELLRYVAWQSAGVAKINKRHTIPFTNNGNGSMSIPT
ncbi:MAG: glycosyltransferase [Ferruginibacter sp.]